MTDLRDQAPPSGARIDHIAVAAYQVPTDGPDGEESDGTLTWRSTTVIVVTAAAEGDAGIGYSYGDVAVARLVDSILKPVVEGGDPFRVPALWQEQMSALRNAGRSGVGSMALAAVDIALWDLQARLLGLPLYRLLPSFHERVPVYGSGGFCNYPLHRLRTQLGGWVEQGIDAVKVKTSRHPGEDPERLSACRQAIGDGVALMTDANGALTRKQALDWARRLRGEWGVSWFEEPVTSDDREGLRLLRERGPAGLEVAAGEYGFVLRDFTDLLEAGAVDCLQADVTRCGGITGLLQVAGLCAAHGIDVSAHCAPSVSAHAFCAVRRLRHLEYFHDHARLEPMLFDGTPTPVGGMLEPDRQRAGLGLAVKHRDAERYLIYRDRD